MRDQWEGAHEADCRVPTEPICPKSGVPTEEERAAALSLMDLLAARMGCSYLSDLPHLDAPMRLRLADVLEKIPAEDYDLAQWNDALRYLADARPRKESWDARMALIVELSTPPASTERDVCYCQSDHSGGLTTCEKKRSS